MTFEEFRKLPEAERLKIQKELLGQAPKASTDLEYWEVENEQ